MFANFVGAGSSAGGIYSSCLGDALAANVIPDAVPSGGVSDMPGGNVIPGGSIMPGGNPGIDGIGEGMRDADGPKAPKDAAGGSCGDSSIFLMSASLR